MFQRTCQDAGLHRPVWRHGQSMILWPPVCQPDQSISLVGTQLGRAACRRQNIRTFWKRCFVLCGWLPFCKSFFDLLFVRSSLVSGLLMRHTWPLALMVSTNQVPFRISNSKRSGQSTGSLGFRADKFSIISLVLQFLIFLMFKWFLLCKVHCGLEQPRSFARFCLP